MNPELIKTIIICIISGLGAGVATGFAGLSAAAFISPMLIAFLGLPAYEAIGISLASDVLASAVSAYSYKRNDNIDLKRGHTLLITVIGFAIVGSIVSFFITASDTGNSVMSGWMILATFLLGLKFLFFRGNKEKTERTYRFLTLNQMSLLCGIYIGFVCGFQGTGGGMMMLFALTSLLGFEFKKAVGTSVFIMSFTACIGAVTHFIINGVPDVLPLVICIIFTLIGAQVSARIANHMSSLALHRSTGVLLTVSGIIMMAVNYYFYIN